MASSRSLGSLTLDLILKTGGFIAGMTAAQRATQKSLGEIEKSAYAVGEGLKLGFKIGAAAVSAAALAIGYSVKKAIDSADQIKDLSTRLGISTEILSGYGYAASQTGTDIDSLSNSLKTLAKNAVDALDPKSAKSGLFKALGVEVKDANGQLKQLDQLLPEIADKFRLMEDGTTKAALAQELFGKSGLEIIEFLNQGSQGLEDFADKAEKLGVIIDTKTAQAADEFNDKLGDLKAQVDGISLSIAGGLLPQLSKSTDEFSELVKQGDLANNIISILNVAFQSGTVLLRGYNRAVQEMSISIGFAVQSGKGLLELQHNVATFGAANGSVVGGLKRISHGYGEASEASKILQAEWKKEDDLRRVREQTAGQYTDSNVRRRGGGLTASELAANARDRDAAEATAKRLRTYLGDPTPDKKKGGKSEAEKDAESLQKAYESQNEALAQQIALFGQTGEASKLRYELEFGELSKLTQAQKDGLLVQAEKLDQMGLEKELGDAANKRLMEESEAISEGVKQTDDLIADMEFELELIGKTNAEREKAIALRSLDANATDEQRAAVAGLVDELHRAEELQGIVDDFKEGLSDAFTDFVTRAKTAKEAFGDFMDDLFKRAVQFTTDKAIDALFGAFGGQGQAGAQSGGGTDWMSIIAGLFGGARATGGSVLPGKFYRVNENGTEMFSQGGNDYLMTGSKGGMVTPSHKIGGVTQNNNFIFSAPTSQRTQEQAAQRAGFEVEQAQRRNG